MSCGHSRFPCLAERRYLYLREQYDMRVPLGMSKGCRCKSTFDLPTRRVPLGPPNRLCLKGLLALFVLALSYMLFDLLLGLLGPLLGLLAIWFLGKSKLSRKQRILVFLLSGLTFVFYVIFGLFDFSLYAGPELNFGAFQISYGISESLFILFQIILPVILGIFLFFALKKFSWLRRLLVPVVLVLAVGSINYFQTYREHEYNQRYWDFEEGLYNDCLGCTMLL